MGEYAFAFKPVSELIGKGVSLFESQGRRILRFTIVNNTSYYCRAESFTFDKNISVEIQNEKRRREIPPFGKVERFGEIAYKGGFAFRNSLLCKIGIGSTESYGDGACEPFDGARDRFRIGSLLANSVVEDFEEVYGYFLHDKPIGWDECKFEVEDCISFRLPTLDIPYMSAYYRPHKYRDELFVRFFGHHLLEHQGSDKGRTRISTLEITVKEKNCNNNVTNNTNGDDKSDRRPKEEDRNDKDKDAGGDGNLNTNASSTTNTSILTNGVSLNKLQDSLEHQLMAYVSSRGDDGCPLDEVTAKFQGARPNDVTSVLDSLILSGYLSFEKPDPRWMPEVRISLMDELVGVARLMAVNGLLFPKQNVMA